MDTRHCAHSPIAGRPQHPLQIQPRSFNITDWHLCCILTACQTVLRGHMQQAGMQMASASIHNQNLFKFDGAFRCCAAGRHNLIMCCRYIELLKDAVDSKGSGRGLFFSYGADLTLTQQRVAILAENAEWTGQPLWKRADTRFFWNRKLALPFMGAPPPFPQAPLLPFLLGIICM